MVTFGCFHICVMLSNNGFLGASHIIARSEHDIRPLNGGIQAYIMSRLRLKRRISFLIRWFDIRKNSGEAATTAPTALLSLVSEETAAKTASVDTRRTWAATTTPSLNLQHAKGCVLTFII